MLAWHVRAWNISLHVYQAPCRQNCFKWERNLSTASMLFASLKGT